MCVGPCTSRATGLHIYWNAVRTVSSILLWFYLVPMRTQAEFTDSMENNRRWTAATWWPQPGMPVYEGHLCDREFVMTWEFQTQPNCTTTAS